MRAFDQFKSDTLARGWEYVFGLYANAQPRGLHDPQHLRKPAR